MMYRIELIFELYIFYLWNLYILCIANVECLNGGISFKKICTIVYGYFFK